MFRTPLVALAAFLLAPLAANAAAPGDVDTLLARSRAALGGDAIAKLRAVYVVSDIETVGIKGTQEQWLDLAGNRYAEYQDAGPISGADGFDGTTPWQRDSGKIVHDEANEQSIVTAVDQAYTNGFALWMPGRGGATVTSGGEKTVGGKAYDVLSVTPRGGVPFDLYFDQKTALPARSVTTVAAQTVTATFDDYRPVAGALWPYRIHVESDDGNASDVRTTRIDANPANLVQHLQRPQSDAHDYSIANGAASTTIPFTLVDNHVYVDVRIDGKGPFHFIFDSGGANLIDPGVLKELGGASEGNAQGSGVGEKTESAAFATIKSLQVGDATLTDQSFLTLPVRAGFGVAGGKPADGLIGYEVLSRFVTTFDYGRNQIVLRMPGASTAGFGTAVPFVFHQNTPEFTGAIDGIPAVFTVDTGSRTSLDILKPYLDAHPSVRPTVLTQRGVDGFGIGGPVFGALGRVGSVQIGPFTIPDVIAGFSEQRKGAFADPYTAANVGGEMWKRFALTFDYPHSTLYLAPNASFSERDHTDRSGAFLILHDGKPTIYDVRAGTPAQTAGLAKGDVLTGVDGKSTQGMALAQIRDVLAGASGTKVRLNLLRGGAPQTLVVTLHDYV
jgi:PDZ domain-containing protein/aspartyl protease